MALGFQTGIELLKTGYKMRTDALLMQRWMLHYESEMSFEDFKDKLFIHSTEENKTEKEILDDVKDILITFNKGV